MRKSYFSRLIEVDRRIPNGYDTIIGYTIVYQNMPAQKWAVCVIEGGLTDGIAAFSERQFVGAVEDSSI